MTPFANTFNRESVIDGYTAWTVFLAGAFGSAVLLLTSGGDLGQKIAAMTLLALAAGTAVRFDIMHPFVWFAGSFTLYSVSGPLLLNVGVHPYVTWGGYRLDELDFLGAMDLQYLAMLVALLIVGPRRVSFAYSVTDPRARALYDGAFSVMVAAGLVGAINIVQIAGQDFASKGDVVLSNDWTTRLSFAFNIAATALGVFLAKLLSEKRIGTAYLTLFAAVAIGVAMVLLIGQRHFLFRAGLICFVVFHIFHRQVSVRSLLLVAFMALTLSTVLGGYKMALVVQDVLPQDTSSLWEKTLELIALRNPAFLNEPPVMQYIKVGLVAALGSEAMTPGNNMAMLLSRVPQDLPYFYGSTIIGDLMRSVLPGFIVQPLVESTGAVYNRLVFPDTAASGGGVGFTIAGYGYLHFGIAGIFLIMGTIGLALRATYRWAARSAMGLMFFIGFFPVSIYIARNDISGPLSQGLKHVLLPLIAMVVFSHLLGRGQFQARR